MNWRLAALGLTGVGIFTAGAILVPRLSGDAAPDPEPEPGTGGGGGDPPDDAVDTGDGAPPPIGDSRWSIVPTDLQKLLTQTQKVAKIPWLWAYGSICAHRESQFVSNAHNNDATEVKGSTDGIDNGIKRGNPKPKYADEIRLFGSGGLFGALASSFAWIGLDAGFMPFLNRRPEFVYNPQASAVFLAHYFYRITSPGYANGRKLSMFDVRVGWASPTMLKESPNGNKAAMVKKRMREDIAALGWDEQWVTSLPVNRSGYTGIKAVAGSFNFSPDQKD